MIGYDDVHFILVHASIWVVASAHLFNNSKQQPQMTESGDFSGAHVTLVKINSLL